MTRNLQHRRSCRIVIGLRPSADSDSALEAATLLASAIEAEVVGLYVKDDALFDLADLPFARVVGHRASNDQRLTRDAMTKAVEQGAITCRRVLSTYAQKAQVSWSFSSEQGTPAAKVRSAAAIGDFLVLSGDRFGFGLQGVLDELRGAPQGVRGVLVSLPMLSVAGPGVRSSGPVIAIDDGDALGRDTIMLASRIAQTNGAELHLIAIAGTDEDADRIVSRANDLALAGQTIVQHRIAPGAADALLEKFSQLGPSFIVADRQGQPFNSDENARALLRAARAPVVLLKSNSTG
jgi:hypothetical protein